MTRRDFKPLLRNAGLPDIRFHDLRQAAATLLLSQGVSVKAVSEQLDHGSVAILVSTSPTQRRLSSRRASRFARRLELRTL